MSLDHASIVTGPLPRKGRKYFSVDEANSALPYLERVVRDISATYRQAVKTRQRIEHPHREDSVESLKDEYEQFMDRLNDLIDELHQVGVELKDFEKGLIDFPAIHNGREVFLCWQCGESRIGAWHEVDAGYSSRQDIALLKTEAA